MHTLGSPNTVCTCSNSVVAMGNGRAAVSERDRTVYHPLSARSWMYYIRPKHNQPDVITSRVIWADHCWYSN